MFTDSFASHFALQIASKIEYKVKENAVQCTTFCKYIHNTDQI